MTESHTVYRFEQDGESHYRATDREEGTAEAYLSSDSLSEVLADGLFSVEETTARDGVTLTTLASTDFDPAPWSEDLTDVADAAALVVDATGVIREVSLTIPEDGQSFSFTVAELGLEEPTEPEWADDVPEVVFADVEIDVDVVAENRAVELENVGTDSVPAGSSVTVTDDTTEYGSSLDSPLTAGDVRYLSVRDGELVSSDEHPSNTATAFESPVSVSVVSPGRVSLASTTVGWSSESDSSTEAGHGANETESATGDAAD